MQMKEQAQSLDVLTQELVDRNTELSNEVAKYKAEGGSSNFLKLDCDQKMVAQNKEFEAKIERIRKTQEDLVNELKRDNEALRAKIVDLQKVKSEASKASKSPKAKASKSEEKKN